jgi:hypothetical protein
MKISPNIVILLTFVLLSGCATDVSFESSDGKWADNEIIFKGREFEQIVWYFEKYKMKSGNVDAELYRTTEPGFFSNRFEIKWKVPYRPSAEHINGGYYVAPEFRGRVDINHSEKERQELDRRAEAYIESLKK